MPEDFRKQIDDAVRAARREEPKNKPFSDEDAKSRIEWHLLYNSKAETQQAPNDLVRMKEWAYQEYGLDLLRKLRFDDAKQGHEDKK